MTILPILIDATNISISNPLPNSLSSSSSIRLCDRSRGQTAGHTGKKGEASFIHPGIPGKNSLANVIHSGIGGEKTQADAIHSGIQGENSQADVNIREFMVRIVKPMSYVMKYPGKNIQAMYCATFCTFCASW